MSMPSREQKESAVRGLWFIAQVYTKAGCLEAARAAIETAKMIEDKL